MSDSCGSIKKYFDERLSQDDEVILNKLSDYAVKVRLGGIKTKEKYGLTTMQVSDLKRVWLRYEDIDNDGVNELFADWVSYANSMTDNRSTIFIFDYPNKDHLVDLFSKGKRKSEFYPVVEDWMIKSYQWDSYSGPVGAKNLLPEVLELKPGVLWQAGKGFSDPVNDYFLNVFSVNGKQYVLVSGRHGKYGKYFVVEVTNIEAKSFKAICEFGS